MELTEYLETVENKLIRNFDITRDYMLNDLEYDFYGKFYMRNEKYLLVKKAVIYAFENNEHVFIKGYKDLNKKDYHIYTDNLIKSIRTVINPTREHMCSIISGVIVADSVLEEDLEYITKSVRKFIYNKSFAFGYKGWVEIRLLLVSLKSGLIATNKKGKEVASIYDFC